MNKKAISSRSKEYRITRREYSYGRIKTMGLDKHGLTVYHFQGLGYWICPPFVHVYESKIGNMVIRSKTSITGVRSKTVSDFTPDLIVNAIRIACTPLEKHNLLFTHPTKTSYLSTEPAEFFEIHPDRSWNDYVVTVVPRQGVTDVYGVEQIRRYTSDLNKIDGYIEELTALKIEMIELFRKRYSITVEEALTFHKENPAVTTAE